MAGAKGLASLGVGIGGALRLGAAVRGRRAGKLGGGQVAHHSRTGRSAERVSQQQWPERFLGQRFIPRPQCPLSRVEVMLAGVGRRSVPQRALPAHTAGRQTCETRVLIGRERQD